MAFTYKRTVPKVAPKLGEKTTRDTLYWKHLEFPVTKKEHGAVSHVEFCPVKPFNYAVTSSARVQVHSCSSHEVVKNLTRFQQVAYSGSFRGDGKLLVAGGEDGSVKLFDVAGKSLLRTFRGHKGPVHVSRFLGDNAHVMSGGDDLSVRVWDIPSQTEIHSFTEHTDYVRCGTTSKASKDILLTGSYDHHVNMYDTRTASSVLSVDHGHPVESVLMFPGGGIFISAGSHVIKVWDALAGGRLLLSFSNHFKTVTSLGFCSDYKRLFSASLDRHVKIYDVGTYQVVHSLVYPSAILSAAISPDDSLIAVGMTDGLLSVQRRRDHHEIRAEKQEQKKQKKAAFQYRLPAQAYTPSKDDLIVERTKQVKFEEHDRYLKSFQHSKALDCAMALRVRLKTPEVTVSVMQELIRRNALQSALAGRDTKSLTAILRFIQKNISNPKCMGVIIDVANVVLDIYRTELLESSGVEETLLLLKRTVEQEVDYMHQLLEVAGTLDTLFASAQVHSGSTNTQISDDIDKLRQSSDDTLDSSSLQNSVSMDVS